MQVGFLIAGNDVHHVAHVIPIAREFARARPDCQVHILTTGKAAGDEVDAFSTGDDVRPAHLRLVPHQRVWGVKPDPQAVLREADVLPRLNTLIVTRASMAFADQHPRPCAAKIIYLAPGADDPARRDGRWAMFDQILVAGERGRARLVSAGGVDPGRISVVGGPAFEAPAQTGKPPFAGDGRRIVLYNPHHDPDISSWHRWGRTILDWFIEHDDHLLIFAPHPRLFERRFIRTKRRLWPVSVRRLEDRYLSAPNIHVDLGGSRSRARAYTDVADIYLGDAGGLLYEFIARPRPCAFLNAHELGSGATDRRPYDWQAGHVIDDPKLLRSHLHTAQEWHADVYRSVQQEMFAQMVSIGETPAARRAAIAISRVVRS